MKKPTPLNPKKKRTHLRLLPENLQRALQTLANTSLDPKTKRAVGDVLATAANADHGKPAVIVKSLPADRQKLIVKTAKRMQTVTDDVMTRGKAKLLDISDDEWDAIVNESIN